MLIGFGLMACDETITEQSKSEDSGQADAGAQPDAGNAPTVRAQISEVSPANGSVIDAEAMTLSFAVAEAAATGYKVELAGAEVAASAESLAVGAVVRVDLNLSTGTNLIQISLVDGAGTADTEEIVYVLAEDATPNPPQVVINPVSGLDDDATEVTLTGQITSSVQPSASWAVGDRSGEITPEGEAPNWTFSAEVPLAVGTNNIVVTANNAGGSGSATVILDRDGDTVAPQLSLAYPYNGFNTATRNPQIRGAVSDDDVLERVWVTSGTTVVEATVADGRFTAQLPLSNLGDNAFVVHAVDESGNSATVEGSFYYGSRIDGAGAHGGVIREDGALFMWGRNNQGQAGIGVETSLGDDNHPSSPTRVRMFDVGTSTTIVTSTITGAEFSLTVNSDVMVSVDTDSNSTMVLDADGHVWAFGRNTEAQLCLPQSEPPIYNSRYRRYEYQPGEVFSPRPVAVDGVIALALGSDFSLFLKADGQVYACGSNELVVPEGSEIGSPVLVPGLSNIVQIVAGGTTAYAVDAEGRIFAWGDNDAYQLGRGDDDEESEQNRTPTEIPNIPAVTQMAASGRHILALTRDNSVYGWGLNYSNQVGDFDERYVTAPSVLTWSNDTELVFVGASGNQSYMETAAGKLYGWGQNLRGSLGVQSDDDQPVPTTPVFGVDYPLCVGVGNLMAFSLSSTSDAFYSWGWSFQGSMGAGDGAVAFWSYRNPLVVAIPQDAEGE